MSFDAALAFTTGIGTSGFGQEGGWYDGSLPSDPNPTFRGVTQSRYDEFRTGAGLARQSVHLMTDDEAREIYLSYWAGAHCSALPPLTAGAVFDHAVNAGISNGVKALQRGAGLSGAAVDGQWGPQTAAAVAVAASDITLAQRVLWARLALYYEDAAHVLLRPNLESWLGRVLAYYATLAVP